MFVDGFVIGGGSGVKPSSSIATPTCQEVESLLRVFALCFLMVLLLVVVVV